MCDSNHAIWKTNLTNSVSDDFGAEHARLTNAARVNYAQEGGLEKNELFIADWLSAGRAEGLASATLARLCTAILQYARGL